MVTKGYNEKSKANLKMFQPGQTGNPGGKAKGTMSITAMLRKLIEGNPVKVMEKWKKEGATGAQLVAIAMFQKMNKGEGTMIAQGLERLEGRVPQRIDTNAAEIWEAINAKAEDARAKVAKRLDSIAAQEEADRIIRGDDR